MNESPETHYTQRCATFGQQRDDYAARWSRIANLRLLLFVGALLCAGIGVWRSNSLAFIGAALLGGGFLVAVVWHNQLQRRSRRYETLWTLNNEGFARLQRDWATLPLRRPQHEQPLANPTAYDLDLLGHASLQHLLNTAHTPVGQLTLEHWLCEPATPPTVVARQAAVSELAPQIDLRDELALQGYTIGGHEQHYQRLVAWAERAPWLTPRTGLLWTTRLSPLLLIALVAIQFSGVTPLPLWLLPLLANIALTAVAGRQADLAVQEVIGRDDLFAAYGKVFDTVVAQRFSAPHLVELRAALAANNQGASQHMQRLRRIAVGAEVNRSVLYPLLQFGLLWNFHVLWFLERWQHNAGPSLRSWFAVFGEIEALAALATLHHDNPTWIFPSVVVGNPVVDGQQLGHPLLAPDKRVSNDVSIGPSGSFLLITGSNMSGKSTLLRAVGTNIVLAQAGAPVCAQQLQLPPLVLATSMRVQDSLAQGVSYFMAELQRLKSVVDTAEQVQSDKQRTLCFLLDEILHGTNTTERQIAAREIIKYLVEHGAIGAVSTHDLTLAQAPELQPISDLVHFREQFVDTATGPTMRFDYHLRPGLATSTNALKLMELVGLPTTRSSQRDNA